MFARGMTIWRLSRTQSQISSQVFIILCQCSENMLCSWQISESSLSFQRNIWTVFRPWAVRKDSPRTHSPATQDSVDVRLRRLFRKERGHLRAGGLDVKPKRFASLLRFVFMTNSALFHFHAASSEFPVSQVEPQLKKQIRHKFVFSPH